MKPSETTGREPGDATSLTAEEAPGLAILVDIDNTLLDNDRVQEDLTGFLESELGEGAGKRYWEIYERLRHEVGYADYLGALQRYRTEVDDEVARSPRFMRASFFLLDYPFESRLYPRALEVLAHLARWGATVILSDGDAVYQPRKARRAGIWDAVDGRVLIYTHKEKMIDDVERRFPARRYIMVDDKPSILAAMKDRMQDRLTTVFPRQGHYAHDAAGNAKYRPADVSIERIADLLEYESPALLAPGLAEESGSRTHTGPSDGPHRV